jgi:hypothetical protein
MATVYPRILGCALATCFCADSAIAGTIVIWDLKNIAKPGLYEKPFALERSARLRVQAVGGGAEEEGDLLTYAWILNAETREPAWVQTRVNTVPYRGENRRFDDVLDLPRGRYIAYFSALGRSSSETWVLKLPKLKLGEIRSSRRGFWTEWDEIGDPADWSLRIALEGESADASDLGSYDGTYPLPALIRLAPLGNDAFKKVAFHVDRPLVVDLSGTAEYWEPIDGYVDRSWIVDAWAHDVIWRVEDARSVPAGGDQKNRAFKDRLELQPGDYLLFALTDDSHAHDSWNATPPLDPQSWGVTMLAADERQGGGIRLIEDPEERLLIARIDRVPNSAFVRKAFRLDRRTMVHVEGLGELGVDDRFYDYGWIERLPLLDVVWSMEDAIPGDAAGGHPKNRRVDARLDLDEGSYVLNYVTDDSHAYGAWNVPAPLEPTRWGIAVYAAERGFDPSTARIVKLSTVDPAVVSLAPTGNSMHRKQTFTLRRDLDLRLVALGEGVDGRMYDYGWIERLDDQEIVWKMEYRDTRPAGGGSKNRIVETIIHLPAGRYQVHFETDDSHSFEGWNVTRPDRPQLWGITLYRVEER